MSTKIPITQSAFTSGVIGASAQARHDVNQLLSGAAEIVNSLPLEQGGLVHRLGTEFIGEVKFSAKITRLEPFIFSVDQALVLEIGDKYIRFWLNGGLVIGAYTAWVTTTEYKVGSLVTEGGNHYRALVTHQSGTFATDLADEKWELTAGATDVAYEIATNYSSTIVNSLSITGTADVMYICDGLTAPTKLLRYANDDWELVDLLFEDGPFESLNTDSSLTVSIPVVQSAIIINSSKALFTTTDVGRLFRIQKRATNLNEGAILTCRITNFTSETEVTAATIFKTLTTADNGVEFSDWRFGAFAGQTSASTVYEITSATAGHPGAIGTFIPAGNAYNPTTWARDDATIHPGGPDVGITGYGILWDWSDERWILGRWENGRLKEHLYWNYTASSIPPESGWVVGYAGSNPVPVLEHVAQVIQNTGVWPSVVQLHQERLIYSRTSRSQQKLWASQTAGYENFAPTNETNEVVDDSAFTYSLAGGDTVDEIIWMISAKELITGTSGGEFFSKTGDELGTLTPTNVSFERNSNRGSAPNQKPHLVGSDIVFVQKLGRTVRAMTYDAVNNAYVGRDLTKLNDTALSDFGGFVGSVLRPEPSNIISYYTATGDVITLTIEAQDQVIAWANHSYNGRVTSACVIPGSITRYDTYFLVERTINGAPKQYIEKVSAENTDPNYWSYLDSSIEYHDDSVAISTATGLEHLEGELVAIFADGEKRGTATVVSGEVALGGNYNHVVVGYAYSTRIKLLDIELQTESGSTHGKEKRVVSITTQVLNTLDVKVGDDLLALDLVEMDSESELNTGVYTTEIDNDFAKRNNGIYIVHDEPVPCTILAVTREVEFRD
jgi:hypothetical protein